jgi:trimethylamine:corrinoid methyltransferase-like protein
MSDDNECVGRHTVRIDELGRISYATITAVPEPGVLIVRQAGCMQALKRVGGESSTQYDSCSMGEWLLESWWPQKQHLHCIEQ